ncbi:hypothetical protein GCM10023219_32110 [Stakelama sediminis]|uniref:Ferric-dicitrate binding protein FerR (Iron transport regulator) n=1 Tax=Stakelama sediminis TaxID=463200 RepID=A0A840Z1E0_9SPHN|nr:hypothetical protein [Stakelama sediminis]MBB5719597.1 ferric-dicitrate binding protein FerR (iron transport regulator) [Stakelama sediminis]
MHDQRSPLDDDEYAAFAWARYRRILKWMGAFAAFVAIGCVLFLWWWADMMPLHMAIATALGVWLTIMLAAALMGLMFLSSGSGHDEAVDRFNRDA